jgi:hypothetical protein
MSRRLSFHPYIEDGTRAAFVGVVERLEAIASIA